MGMLAVGFLEWRDHRRNRDPDWRRRIAVSAGAIQSRIPGIPAETARQVAQKQEEQRLSPLALAGMALGGLCLVCGVAMLVVRVVGFFSGK